MARYDQQGNEVSAPTVFPWKLRFANNGAISFPATVSAGYRDYTQDLASIPSGTKIFDIYAMDQPEELGGTEKLIGQMVSSSELTTSNWGDEHLYFRH